MLIRNTLKSLAIATMKTDISSIDVMINKYGCQLLEKAGAKYGFDAVEAKQLLIGIKNKDNALYYNIKMSTAYDEKTDISNSQEINNESKKKGSNIKALENENDMINSINSPTQNATNKAINDLIENETTKTGMLFAHKVLKKNGCKVSHTEKWKEHKNGTKERAAKSKADAILVNDGLRLGISFKSGPGRFTSSDCYETNAIFKSVYFNKYKNKTDGDKIKEKIDNIEISMKKLPKYTPIKNNSTLRSITKEMKQNHDLNNADTEWVNNLDKTTEECNKLWNELIKNHVEYVYDVLYETLSGEYKFGDNDGRAHLLLVTKSSQSQEIDHKFDLRQRTEELDKYLAGTAKQKNPFKCKSGGTGKQMWVRFL